MKKTMLRLDGDTRPLDRNLNPGPIKLEAGVFIILGFIPARSKRYFLLLRVSETSYQVGVWTKMAEA
jgi:hypothetical protein